MTPDNEHVDTRDQPPMSNDQNAEDPLQGQAATQRRGVGSSLRVFLNNIKSMKLALFLCQVVSLLIALTGVTNTQLNELGVNIPTAQSLVVYFILAVVYFPIWLYKTNDSARVLAVISKKWFIYLILALIDVEANFLMVKAYSLTIVTTIQIIDVFVLPATLVLSYFILKQSFRVNHILGVTSCLIGCGLIVAGDYFINPTHFSDHRLIGDLLCLLSSCLYAVSNVGAEVLVKGSSNAEYLSLIGANGLVVSVVQVLIIEREKLAGLPLDNAQMWLLALLYNSGMFLVYTLIPIIMQISSAAFFNVNLLTADFYTILNGILIKKYQLHYLYFVGFVFIVIGTIVYSLRKTRDRRSAVAQSNNLSVVVSDSELNDNQD